MDPTKGGSEEIRDKEVDLKVEQTADDRIDSLEDAIALQNEQISEIANEQTKIVEILEQMSEKINRPSVEDIEEDVEVEDDLTEEKNSVEEATDTKESPEVESEEAEEPEEKSDAEEVEVDTAEESKGEEQEVENDAQTADEESSETEEEPAEEEAQETNNKENTMTPEELNALKEQIKNQILDEMVKEPEVKEAEKEEEKVDNSISKDWKVRYNDQVAAAWDAYRLHNAAAMDKLAKINAFNASLKVENDAGTAPITIESLDSFVLPPEVDTMIHGRRTRYTDFLNKIEYVTTDRLTFAYATRVGDIDMRNVALCDDNEDGNLKPIETYGLEQGVAQMEELAAVTPICDNATKYMAIDILADLAAGYRNDFDRKLAQLAILRIQQAINTTAQTVEFDPADSVEALVDFVKATTLVADGVVNGTFVFNAKTKAKLVEYIFRAAAAGDLGRDAMTTGDFPTIFGYPYVVVPNDLMPTLGGTEQIAFQATNNATGQLETVNITSPVFYGDLDEFRGKVSGALRYDVSAEASYEVTNASGSKETRSAWQRNELVLRGSFLRGGYIADASVFSGLVPKA